MGITDEIVAICFLFPRQFGKMRVTPVLTESIRCGGIHGRNSGSRSRMSHGE